MILYAELRQPEEILMKRSAVNSILTEGDAFIRSFGFVLPPFAYWSAEKMRAASGTDIHARGLGWDITDYGEGRFDEMGLFLFTTRNGRVEQLNNGKGMLYAEKIMITRDRQLSPMHRHNVKAEDIINRGGGDLVIELFAPDADGGIDRTSDITVPSDGMPVTLSAGGHLRLKPDRQCLRATHRAVLPDRRRRDADVSAGLGLRLIQKHRRGLCCGGTGYFSCNLRKEGGQSGYGGQ